MTLFILLLFLFSIFFTFDNKPINLLLDFIGIILSISFYLLLFNNTLDLSFFSFIFIIIYGSALAILFAFILMLFSNSNTNSSFYTNSNLFKSYPIKFLSFFDINLYPAYHFFSSFIKLYLFPILLSFTFISFIFYWYLLDTTIFSAYLLFLKPTDPYFIPDKLVNYIYHSFINNTIPLILIINILLLGLIGAVFLLI